MINYIEGTGICITDVDEKCSIITAIKYNYYYTNIIK